MSTSFILPVAALMSILDIAGCWGIAQWPDSAGAPAASTSCCCWWWCCCCCCCLHCTNILLGLESTHSPAAAASAAMLDGLRRCAVRLGLGDEAASTSLPDSSARARVGCKGGGTLTLVQVINSSTDAAHAAKLEKYK